MIPVYVVNGFLGSGKTDFINYTLQQPYFRMKGKTLLLVCEEGEVSYDESVLKGTGTILLPIEEEKEFTSSKMLEWEKQWEPKRIVIEFNGMWNYQAMKLPLHWKIEQQITTIDASTFVSYYTNMRSLLGQMIRKSEMIIFNRCDGIDNLAGFRRNIQALNPDAEIIFEDADGEIREMTEEELPYSLSEDVIVLKDDTFAIWYLDAMDHLSRYQGKTIRYLAQVFFPSNFPEGYMVPGRTVMTCCADDLAFLGYVCDYRELISQGNMVALESKQWIMLEARVDKKYWKEYQKEGPLLIATKIEPAKKPKQDILSFS